MPNIQSEAVEKSFMIVGPARTLGIKLAGEIATYFFNLNLVSGVPYVVIIGAGEMPGTQEKDPDTGQPVPGTGRATPTVSFYRIDSRCPHAVYYFSRPHNMFVQIFIRHLDDKSRVVLPKGLLPASWDDEGGAIVLNY
jgi:hypothetical protein